MELEYALLSIGVGIGLGMLVVTRPTKEQRESKKLTKQIAKERFLKYKREHNPDYSESSILNDINEHLVVPVFLLSAIVVIGTKFLGLW